MRPWVFAAIVGTAFTLMPPPKRQWASKQPLEETRNMLDEKTFFKLEYLSLISSIHRAREMIKPYMGKRGKWLVIGKYTKDMGFVDLRVVNTRDKNYVIKPTMGKGISKSYEVLDREGNEWIPLVAYLRYRGRDYIYTPYNDFFNTEYVINGGLAYIKALQEKAKSFLLKTNYTLRDGRRVWDVVPDDIFPLLFIIEHTDLSSLSTPEKAEFYTNVVLSTIGLNRERAYIYSESYVGARGLAQFTKTTWRRLWWRYVRKDDNLKQIVPRSFYKGSRDALASVIMMYLFFHDNLLVYENIGKLRDLEKDKDNLVFNLLTTYNGGIMPSIDGISIVGPDWWKKRWALKRLNKETVFYIKKALAIHDMVSSMYSSVDNDFIY